MNIKILAPAIAIGVALIGLTLFLSDDSQPYVTIAPTYTSVIQSDAGISELQLMETDGVKHLISLDKIKGGGPQKMEFHQLIILFLLMLQIHNSCQIPTL